MGTYYSQTLTVSGPKDDFDRFLDVCFRKEATGRPLGIDFARVAPGPKILPDGLSCGPLGRDVDVGVEAITGEPRRVDGRVVPSVLTSAQAKWRGLQNHRELFRWVRKKRPLALLIGQDALRAHAETGYWTQQEWQYDNWGVDHGLGLMDFTTASFTNGAIAVRFSTKGTHIGPFVRTVGQRFPTLNIRLAALDDGDERPYLATCNEGTFAEEYVELTKEFVIEVEGRPRGVWPEFTRPSVIRPWPATHFRYWFAKRKISRLLPGYPVYEPVFPGLPATLSSEQADANFERFMSTRVQRINQLRGFLGKFHVPLESSDDGLRKLDRWIARYGAFLIVKETGASFKTFVPAWRDERLGHNVIFDLAAFIGEVVIEQNPGFYWELYRDVPVGARKGNPHYQSLAIRGTNPRAPWRIWPSHIYETCRALRERSFMWQKPFIIMPRDVMSKPATHIVMQVRDTALNTHWEERPIGV